MREAISTLRLRREGGCIRTPDRKRRNVAGKGVFFPGLRGAVSHETLIPISGVEGIHFSSTSALRLHPFPMPYNIDLHCHSWFSGDGVSCPEALIASARKKGLHGFALTDHNTSDGCRYLLDKGLMREDGLPVDGLLIIPGVEVTTAEGHLLCLGVMLPNLKGTPAAEVCQIVHGMGGVTIPPHPYDLFRAGIRQAVLDTLEIDALEVFNAATTFKRYNRLAYEYAARKNLPMTAGSDAHHEAAIGVAYTILHTDDFSVKGILGQIPKSTELSQNYLSSGDKLRKTWNNWLRLRRKRVHRPASGAA
jgi:predicted metal-dependent phosphoesterase TrpH